MPDKSKAGLKGLKDFTDVKSKVTKKAPKRPSGKLKKFDDFVKESVGVEETSRVTESHKEPAFDNIEEFKKAKGYLLELAKMNQSYLDRLYDMFQDLGFKRGDDAWYETCKKYSSGFGELFDHTMTEDWLSKYKMAIKDTQKQVMFQEFSKSMDDDSEYFDEIDNN